MTKKDLIIGEAYVGTFSGNTTGILFVWEGKFPEKNDCKPAINLFDNRLLKDGYLTSTKIPDL